MPCIELDDQQRKTVDHLLQHAQAMIGGALGTVQIAGVRHLADMQAAGRLPMSGTVQVDGVFSSVALKLESHCKGLWPPQRAAQRIARGRFEDGQIGPPSAPSGLQFGGARADASHLARMGDVEANARPGDFHGGGVRVHRVRRDVERILGAGGNSGKLCANRDGACPAFPWAQQAVW